VILIQQEDSIVEKQFFRLITFYAWNELDYWLSYSFIFYYYFWTKNLVTWDRGV